MVLVPVRIERLNQQRFRRPIDERETYNAMRSAKQADRILESQLRMKPSHSPSAQASVVSSFSPRA